MVRRFSSVIGRESRRQIVEKEGRVPDCLIACVAAVRIHGMFIRFWLMNRCADWRCGAGGTAAS